MKSIEITANSYDEAIEQALVELGLTREQVDVENLKESGLIRKKYTVKVTQKITTDILAKTFVQGVIDKMGLSCTAEVVEDAESFTITISGSDTSTLIGYRGDVLDSLQYLTLLVANKANPSGKRIVLDGENYREQRVLTLARLAKKLAYQASKNAEVVSLEPMNPFERRAIHSALADDKFVTTSSEGVEPNRYVVITPNRREKRTYDSASSGERKPYQGSKPYDSNRGERKPYQGSKPYDSASSGEHKPYQGSKPYDSSRGERKPYQGSKPYDSSKSYGNHTSQESAPNVATVDTQTNAVPASQAQEKDMYDNESSRKFRKNGASKMRSFGAPKSKYF